MRRRCVIGDEWGFDPLRTSRCQANCARTMGHGSGGRWLYAAGLLGAPEAARDVVQETFLRLCVQDRAEIESRLAEWLFTVCRNRALDVLRKERRMTRLSDEQVHRHASPDPGP